MLKKKKNEKAPKRSQNIFANLSFYWLMPLLIQTQKTKKLHEDDLFHFSDNFRAQSSANEFEIAWAKEKKKHKKYVFFFLIYFFN